MWFAATMVVLRKFPRAFIIVASLATILVLINIAVVMGLQLGASNTTKDPPRDNTCGLPPGLSNLLLKVQADSRFRRASGGLAYDFSGADNESAIRGIVNGTAIQSGPVPDNYIFVGGTPYYVPPTTHLDFYSHGSTSTGRCADDPRMGQGVVGVLEVTIPINPDGSYNLNNMSVSHTSGVFGNGTGFG